MKDSLKEPQIFIQIIIEMIYYGFFVHYLLKLYNFDMYMKKTGMTAQLEKYRSVNVASEILNNGGWDYLFKALFFMFAGVLVIILLHKIGQTSEHSTMCMIIKIIHIIFLMLFLSILWKLIDVPIFHAFIIIAGTTAVATGAYDS